MWLGLRPQHALAPAWRGAALSCFSGFRRFSQQQAWVDPKAQPDEDVLAKYCRDLTGLAKEVRGISVFSDMVADAGARRASWTR